MPQSDKFRRFLNGFLTICSLALLFSTFVEAQNTLLDPSFDGDGKAVALFGPIPLTSKGNNAILQSDGKIVVVGRGNANSGFPESYQFAVARFNPNGSLDNTFDNDGKVTTTPDSSRVSEALAVALQPDGKIVVVGSIGTVDSFNQDAVIIRYNADGSLDSTFDDDGIKLINFDAQNAHDKATDVVIQADGKIIIADRTQAIGFAGAVICRLNSDGSFDPNFGTNGYTRTNFTNSDPSPKIVLQADGKIVATFDAIGAKLVRYNPNGTLDSSFGDNGIANNAGGNALALQPNGQIITVNNVSQVNVLVKRYNQNGALDTTFGINGIAVIAFVNDQGNVKPPYDIALQPDGKIVVGGGIKLSTNPNTDFALARLNNNGAIDLFFGSNGKTTTDIQGEDIGRAVLLQTDGKIVLAGESGGGFTLTRYIPGQIISTCRPVSDFDGDGKSDLATYNDGTWFFTPSSTGGIARSDWGLGSDRLAPADYDGDCHTDFAVFRDGLWYIKTGGGTNTYYNFGQAGDIPVPADYDGDGLADAAVYRNGTWYLNRSRDGFAAIQFGLATDKPIPADYDGDGKTDVAIYRSSTGVWWILRSSDSSYTATQFGLAQDKPVVGDYDGDGKADIAVFRPSNSVWYLLRSSQGSSGIQWGISTDTPVPADYDGDGKTDVAVYRNGTWYLLQSTAGLRIADFNPGGIPIQSVYVP